MAACLWSAGERPRGTTYRPELPLVRPSYFLYILAKLIKLVHFVAGESHIWSAPKSFLFSSSTCPGGIFQPDRKTVCNPHRDTEQLVTQSAEDISARNTRRKLSNGGDTKPHTINLCKALG